MLTLAGDNEIAPLNAGAIGGAALFDAAHEQTVALGQADRGAHAAGGMRRRECDTKAHMYGFFAASERLDALT